MTPERDAYEKDGEMKGCSKPILSEVVLDKYPKINSLPRGETGREDYSSEPRIQNLTAQSRAIEILYFFFFKKKTLGV